MRTKERPSNWPELAELVEKLVERALDQAEVAHQSELSELDARVAALERTREKHHGIGHKVSPEFMRESLPAEYVR